MNETFSLLDKGPTDLNLLHPDDYRINDPTFFQTKQIQKHVMEQYVMRLQRSTRTEVILSNRLVQVLSADRYKIGR